MTVKILVVGGAGYVGGFLSDLLLGDERFQVRVLDNLTYEEIFLKQVDFSFTDVRDFLSLKSHLGWADVVIWLAAIVGDEACALNPAETRKVNVESVRQLRENFGGRIIFASTCSVYGAQSNLLTEDSPLNPLSLYAETKIEAEEILLQGGQALILRLGTLFGIGDSHTRFRSDLVLNLLTARAVLTRKMSVFGGQQFRPLLHVRDVARVVESQIESTNLGIYNLVGENLTIIELAERVRARVPGSQISLSEGLFEDNRNYCVSAEKARQVLRFVPELSVDDGIREVQSLIESGRLRSFEHSRYSNVEALRERWGAHQ